MKKIIFILLFFLTSCSNKSPVKSDYNFDNDMTFDEFKIKLEAYSSDNPYPNINE